MTPITEICTKKQISVKRLTKNVKFMRSTKSILAIVSAGAMTLVACASKPASTPQTQTNEEMKSVIVYFTHSGNTELAAKEVAAVTGAKMIRLQPDSHIHQRMWIG